MEALRGVIKGQVQRLVGAGDGAADLARPEGDHGLFGPDSASARVHGDFAAMMIGGVSALLLQMLHPGALAGVWDHSDFQRDMPGRLRRTAQFIWVTTYGATSQAEQLIARVRGIHDRVAGVLPDGTAYSANDPALLTWVHVAEVDAFLRAHIRYRDPTFPAVEQDRYLTETATLARRLGATDVPETRADIVAYFARMRPRLRADHRTRAVARALLGASSPDPAMAPMGAIMLQAGCDLLPPWAAALHGVGVAGPRRTALRLGALGMGSALRWALSARD